MKLKVLASLPAFALTIGVCLSQLGVFSTLAYPISGPISAPITSPVSTPVPTPDSGSNNSNNQGSNSSGSNGSVGAPSCNDTKPSSAPKLVSIISKRPNQATLTWIKTGDPVTYYLVSYGLNSAANQYGNPNVGGANTTEFTVNGLSGNTTYFFRVRAGNGCMPGDFSSVLSIKPNGKSISTPAIGFKPGVLGTNKISPVVSPKPTSTPVATVKVETNLIERVFSFLGNIFK